MIGRKYLLFKKIFQSLINKILAKNFQLPTISAQRRNHYSKFQPGKKENFEYILILCVIPRSCVDMVARLHQRSPTRRLEEPSSPGPRRLKIIIGLSVEPSGGEDS